jgi:hypothetical protein
MKTYILCCLSLFVVGCASVSLEDGAEKVTIAEAIDPKCLKIVDRELSQTQIGSLTPEDQDRKLLARAKNQAVNFGADQIVVGKQTSGFMRDLMKVTYLACGPLGKVSDKTLEMSCNNDQPAACAQIAVRAQVNKEYAKMFDYFQRACKLSDKSSCDWLSNYEKKKADLKKTCIEKNGPSCFAAAKLADVEMDYSLMMTFLKQGCSYGHSESCFYQNYAQEERERRKEKYQQYMLDLQEQTLRIQQVMTTMAILNQAPTSTNCVSKINIDGSVFTNCR